MRNYIGALFVSSLVVAAFCLSGTPPKICRISGNVTGTCIELSKCPAALNLLQMRSVDVLRRRGCGFQGYQPLICCANDTMNSNDQIRFNESDTSNHLASSRPPTHSSTNPTTNTESGSGLTDRTSKVDNNHGVFNEVQLENNVPLKTTQSNQPKVPTNPEQANGIVTTPSARSRLPNRKECGRQAEVMQRIYGGALAEIYEFPWVARIKYKTANGTEMYGCTGTLISDRYVLTAAHCVGSLVITEIRLGEWDEQTEVDCIQNICNERPVDIKVLSLFRHPLYRRGNSSHDIALILLQESANFTDQIRPICLPTTEFVSKQDYIPDEMSYVTAGWGKTEFGRTSHILQKVNLKAVDMRICRTSHNFIQDYDVNNLICAGGRKGEDTCAGDSGGGLFKAVKEDNSTNCFIFGITSYGSRKCGEEGIPSIYTRVTSYMNWILSIVDPM